MDSAPTVLNKPPPPFLMDSAPTVLNKPPPPFLMDSAPTVPTVLNKPPPPFLMDSVPTFLNKPPPPFPAPPRSVDFSALEFILGLIAVITIPALVYAFFFAIKFPPNPFRRRPHRTSTTSPGPTETEPNTQNKNDVISELKYQKEAHVKEIGTECPVCLSLFADGEEVRQLCVCKHSFHSLCINMWLKDHSNCPICRASVAVDRSSGDNRTAAAGARGSDDLQQGLPDASAMV